MKILLAIDDSKFSQEAVRAVIAYQKRPGLKVRVLHAAEPPTLFEAPEMAEYIPPEETSEEAQALVNKAAGQLSSAGINATARVVRGDPRAVILDEAKSWGAELIVLGSHGRRGLERLLVGSVSEAVLRHAGCSVEIIRCPAVSST